MCSHASNRCFMVQRMLENIGWNAERRFAKSFSFTEKTSAHREIIYTLALKKIHLNIPPKQMTQNHLIKSDQVSHDICVVEIKVSHQVVSIADMSNAVK